jgi:hypothetical protein
MNQRIEKIKVHIRDNGKVYIAIGITFVVTAGITTIIMRNNSVLNIGRDTVVTASRDIVVTGKNSTLNHVSYISAERQGPPSWVVRCLETNKLFTSQRSAAMSMDLAENHLSQHLNGLRDHVNGYHFERICMAA